MVYHNSVFTKEMKQAYIENDVSIRRQVRFGVFLALGAFAIFFVLQALTQSVLMDVMPEFMMSNCFSALSVYLNFAYVCMVIYLLVNYQYVTFAEIRMNRWYILVNMGFNPLPMIYGKLAARAISTALIYSVGFLVTLLLAFLLRYPLVTDYLPGMYIAGLVDLLLISTVTMTISLFIKTRATAKYVVFAAAALMLSIRVISGYYRIIADPSLIGNAFNLFDVTGSAYIIVAAAVFLICLAVGVACANRFAHKYSFYFYKKDLDYPSDVEIVLKRGAAFTPINKNGYVARAQKTALDKALGVVLIVAVSALFVVSALALALSFTAPGTEVPLIGAIPYFNRFDAMQPKLMKNDLLFFEKLAPSEQVSAGEIVLYRKNGQAGVSRVRELSPDAIAVDVDRYAPGSQPDYFRDTVVRAELYGKYSGRSRWLGAVILFYSTTVGRLLLLLVPILLFFHRPILKFFRRGLAAGDRAKA